MVRKILILEDEKLIADLLEKRLLEEGYEVIIKDNPEDGLKILADEKIDLIILDLDLSGFRTNKLLEKKEKVAELKKIPVLVISNSGQVGELSRAKELGAQDWVLKTEFDPREVVQKVSNIFQSIKAIV